MTASTGIASRPVALKVGIGGLGVIGMAVARAINDGMPGLELAAVSARDQERAARSVQGFDPKPAVVPLAALAQVADVVVETAPAEVYDEIARPAIDAGRVLVTLSSGALLSRPDLIAQAKSSGARIIVPSGGIMGLDALKAISEADIRSVELITRKPPGSLAGAPYLLEHEIDVSGLSEPLQVFEGNAGAAAAAFPANANVAATVSLAGIGPERTRVEIWADPGIERNMQQLRVRSTVADFDLQLVSYPAADNPRTGSLTPHSAIATLRALTAVLITGT